MKDLAAVQAICHEIRVWTIELQKEAREIQDPKEMKRIYRMVNKLRKEMPK
jgi:hypothetical protein